MLYNKVNNLFNLIIVCFGIAFLFLYPAAGIDAAKNGVTTALYIVLPSVFPFMVLSKFIIAINLHYQLSMIIGKPFEKLFRLDKQYATIFVLGCIGGYPIGAIAINELLKNNEISVSDAEHLLGFCNNSGPMFVIGTVGTLLLKNTAYGYILYIIHIVSAVIGGIIIGFLFKPKRKKTSRSLRKTTSASPFSFSVSSSQAAMTNIAAYIVIFSVISSMVKKALSGTSHTIMSAVLCFIEITTGIEFVSKYITSEIFRLSIISAALGFSGICVFLQSKAVFENSAVSFKKYLCTKFIIALTSFTITAVVFTIIFSH